MSDPFALVGGPTDLLAVLGWLGVLAVVVWVVYRWLAGGDGDGGAPRRSTTGDAPPLTSWRWVYDVEKADAEREVANVNRQAEVLGEADEELRK